MENWKPIPGWPSYLVSDAGNVKSIFSTGICLKPDNSKGYCRVKLYDKPKNKRIMVHQLVMLTFVGPCPEGKEINHKNAVRSDNRVENLEYCTRKYNQWYANHVTKTRTSQKGSKHGCAKLTEEKVLQIRAMKGKRPLKEIAKHFGVNVPSISLILNRKTWRHI